MTLDDIDEKVVESNRGIIIDALRWKEFCEHCGKTFPHVSKLARHKREFHMLKQHCKYCSWTCRGTQRRQVDQLMSTHFNDVHAETIKKSRDGENIQHETVVRTCGNDNYTITPARNRAFDGNNYTDRPVIDSEQDIQLSDLMHTLSERRDDSYCNSGYDTTHETECEDEFLDILPDLTFPPLLKANDMIATLEMNRKSLKERLVLHVRENESLAQEAVTRIEKLTKECDKLQREKNEVICAFTEELQTNKDIINQLEDTNKNLQMRLSDYSNLQKQNEMLYTSLDRERRDHEELVARLSDYSDLQEENEMLYTSLDRERREHEELVASLESEIQILRDDLDKTKDKFLNTATEMELIRSVVNKSFERTTSNLTVSETRDLQQKIDHTDADARLLAEEYARNIEQFKSGKMAIDKIIDSGKYAKSGFGYNEACSSLESGEDNSDDTFVEGEAASVASLDRAGKYPRRHKHISQTIVKAEKFIVVNNAVIPNASESVNNVPDHRAIECNIASQ